MKHYLISGGSGLIGSELCQQLIAGGQCVTVLSRTPNAVKDKCGSNV